MKLLLSDGQGCAFCLLCEWIYKVEVKDQSELRDKEKLKALDKDLHEAACEHLMEVHKRLLLTRGERKVRKGDVLPRYEYKGRQETNDW